VTYLLVQTKVIVSSALSLSLSSLLSVIAIMPSWTDFAGFAIGLFVVLHLIAFIRPHGWVSRRLHPSFPTVLGDEERKLLKLQIYRLEEIIRLERAQQGQPDPLGDLELVTTVRRSPRLTRANSSIDGLRGPAL
jgi:hypothetical protein